MSGLGLSLRRSVRALAAVVCLLAAIAPPFMEHAASATWNPDGAATASSPAHRVATPPAWPPNLPGCWPTGNSAVADKAAQRFWLCSEGTPVTAAWPMTTASVSYGLPPVGDYPVTSKRRISGGIGGTLLHEISRSSSSRRAATTSGSIDWSTRIPTRSATSTSGAPHRGVSACTPRTRP